jgi:hypothetical protein
VFQCNNLLGILRLVPFDFHESFDYCVALITGTRLCATAAAAADNDDDDDAQQYCVPLAMF